MRALLGSVLLVVVSAFAVGSGCEKPRKGQPIIANGPDSSVAGGVGDGDGGPDGGPDGGGTGGAGFTFGDGGAPSTGCPTSCNELNANCGYVTDTKCGGVVQCGSCTGTDVCGGTDPNRCGPAKDNLPDAGACVSSTCSELGASCGFVTDPKCASVIDCGQDVCPDHCTAGVCTVQACTVDPATTCEGLGYVCGHTADSCGHLLDCGTVTCTNAGDTCIQGVCTPPPPCVVDPATTCAGRNFSCGQAADNCGHLLTCGPSTCPIPGWTCGGGPTQGACGCTGACSQIPTCGSGTTTTLTGKVYDPAGRNPLYHVLVYVANDPTDPALTSFPAGVSCDVCGAAAAGSPLVSTPGATDPPAGEYTGTDGSFTLKNVPAGSITVVIQLGRWRRTFPINVANPCASNSIPDKTFRMPSTQAQGNIPLIAMVTGNSDSLECVLRKIGIAQSEFTDPGQGGRVNFYLGDTYPGQSIDSATPLQSQLFANAGINAYDMTILACRGAEIDESANQAALRNYAAAGGRVFTTHWENTWLRSNDANTADSTADNWSQVAQWHYDPVDYSLAGVPITGYLDTVTNPKATAFQGWLSAVGALNPFVPPARASTSVFVVRHDADIISTVPGRTQQWLYRDGVGHCSLATGTSCAANSDCAPLVCTGKTQTACTVATQATDCSGGTGPCAANTCTGTNVGTRTPLHFTFNTPVNLVQDLTKTPPAVQCGRVLFSDFHVNDADELPSQYYPSQCALNVSRATPSTAGGGACTTDAQCTGTCTAGKCPWGSACTTSAQCASSCANGICLDPMTAQEKLLEYMIFDLGSCVPPAKVCVPKTTCPSGQDCGYAPDGCGGLVSCGTCPSGESCGVGQPPVANHCGKVTCTPKGCPSGVECGFASDGCSDVANCGTCPTGQTCNNGTCGSSNCTPKTCVDQGLECGQAGDECGKSINCPACPANNACISGKCVPLACQPKTCQAQGVECGQAADGCGNKITSCGDCPTGNLCVAGKCVKIN